jgi:putative redox protein
MKATVKWVDGAAFLGESGSGHTILMDGAPDQGGRNTGVRPMEALLIGMGGCSAYDVMSLLRKSRQQVIDCRAELEAERADAVPAVFTRIGPASVSRSPMLRERCSCQPTSTVRRPSCSPPAASRSPTVTRLSSSNRGYSR